MKLTNHIEKFVEANRKIQDEQKKKKENDDKNTSLHSQESIVMRK